MKIGTNISSVNQTQQTSAIKNLYTEKLTKDEAKELRAQVFENANAFTFESTNVQNKIQNPEDKFTQDYQAFQSFLQDIGYNGKPIAELSQDEAAKLVSEDGIFGVKQTSERIANFVIAGANGNEDLLRAGREGMLRGFKEAEDMLGDSLADISKQTMQASTEMVDKAMMDLGYSIIDKEA